MELNKRQLLGLSAGSIAALVAAGLLTPLRAAANETENRIKEFAAGQEIKTGKITLTTPEIAENGNTVPISIDVDSPMTKDDHVASVMLLADGNPLPGVATFYFSPMSGEASATTRIRLATTQNVIAIAKMSNGDIYLDKKQVKVTIGGCGG
ncbi:MAG: thiosulfate oxidation carrier protein SoxY [Hyphomicrobiaceae bacterium]